MLAGMVGFETLNSSIVWIKYIYIYIYIYIVKGIKLMCVGPRGPILLYISLYMLKHGSLPVYNTYT